ncbi:hypothetical protein GCM10020295_05280 [Streptomyces cinereospinus]
MRAVPVARQRVPPLRRPERTRPRHSPQPAFDARITDGHVEVRLRPQDGDDSAGDARETAGQGAAATQ